MTSKERSLRPGDVTVWISGTEALKCELKYARIINVQL